MIDWIDAIHNIITLSPPASQWLVDFLSSEEGLKYIKPYLVEATARDVRINFSHLLEKSLSSQMKHNKDKTESVNIIIQHLISLLTTVSDNIKYCSQYFWLLFMFVKMVRNNFLENLEMTF